MKRSLLVLMSAVLFLSGCTTVYKGPMPDTSLQGNEALAEFQNFRMREGFFDQGEFYNVGPHETLYTRESFKPVVEHISPAAMPHVAKADEWRGYSHYGLAFVLAMAAGTIISNDEETKKALLAGAWAGVAYGWVVGFISVGHMQDAAKQYNQDLYKKVVPSVGVKVDY